MLKPRSLARKLAGRSRLTVLAAFVVVLAVAVPVFAANSFDSNDNGDVAGTTVVVNKPAGLAAGDVMIASVVFRGVASTTVTAPGWTQIAKRTTESGNPDTTLVSFWNEADATEAAAASFTFTLSVGARAFGGIARYDDVVVTAGTPVAASATNPTTDTTNNSGSPATATGVTTTAARPVRHGDLRRRRWRQHRHADAGCPRCTTRGRTTGVEGRLAAFDVSQAAATA